MSKFFFPKCATFCVSTTNLPLEMGGGVRSCIMEGGAAFFLHELS